MKTLYVCHSNKDGFKDRLYAPLRESALDDKVKIILPEEYPGKNFDLDKILHKEEVYILADLTFYDAVRDKDLQKAHMAQVPIIDIHKKGTMVANIQRPPWQKTMKYRRINEIIPYIEEKLELNVEENQDLKQNKTVQRAYENILNNISRDFDLDNTSQPILR